MFISYIFFWHLCENPHIICELFNNSFCQKGDETSDEENAALFNSSIALNGSQRL